MDKNKVNPDDVYKSLVRNIDTPYDEIISFLQRETISCVALKELFDNCKTKKYFEENIDYMIDLAQDIRTTSLNSLFSSYSFYEQIFKKKYIQKFMDRLNR